MEKNSPGLPPWLLTLSSAVLLSGGWLMSSFPVLIFVGVAPLLAVARPAIRPGSSVFEKLELVLVALAVGWVVNAVARDTPIVSALVLAIVFTMAFVAHAWVRRVLGARTGILILIFFWLALEYLMVKFIPSQGFFLADALRTKEDWLRWNIHTGYLGASLWVLLVNGCVYLALLQEKKGIQWVWLVAAILLAAGPVGYSQGLDNSPISREAMINLYQNNPTATDVIYLARGEWIVRTATWLSALILLFTFVRQQTRK